MILFTTFCFYLFSFLPHPLEKGSWSLLMGRKKIKQKCHSPSGGGNDELRGVRLRGESPARKISQEPKRQMVVASGYAGAEVQEERMRLKYNQEIMMAGLMVL